MQKPITWSGASGAIARYSLLGRRLFLRGTAIGIVLAAVGCSGADRDEAPLASTKQAVLVNSPLCDEQGRCSFYMPLPDGVPLRSIGIAANSEARVNDRATLYAGAGSSPSNPSPMPVVSNIQSTGGYVRIGADAKVGHVIGSGEVVVEDRGSVNGNVYAGNPTLRSAARISGKVAPFSEVAYTSRKLLEVVWPTATQGSVIRDPGHDPSGSLSPNAECPELKIGSGMTYTMTQPGDYFIERLVVESGGKLEIDVSAGITRIFVENEIILNGEVEEVTPPDTETSVLLASLASQGIFLNNNFDGVVLAPRAKITARGWLDDEGWRQYRGAFFGKEVEMHQGGVLAVFNNAQLWEPPVDFPTVPAGDTARFVPKVGFLDGTNCNHWPIDKTPSEYLPPLIGSTDDPEKTSDVAWLLDELERTGVSTLTTIGAPRKLEFGYHDVLTPGSSRGVGERRWVVVDSDAHKGYDVSYAGLCTQADLVGDGDDCTTQSWEVAVGDETRAMEVLTRAEPRNRGDDGKEVSLAVLLTAPEVEVGRVSSATGLQDRVELDVSLVVATEYLAGTGSSRLAVKPYMQPSDADTWIVDLAEPSRPGVLAVFAREVFGFESIAAYAGVRFGRVAFLDNQTMPTFWDYPVYYGSDQTWYRELQLPKDQAFADMSVDMLNTSGPPPMTQRMPDWWCDAWYGAASAGYPFFYWDHLCWAGGQRNYCGHLFCNGSLTLSGTTFMQISQDLWWPEITAQANPNVLIRRDFEPGGAVLVSVGSVPAALETLAPPAPPLALDEGSLSQPEHRIPHANLGYTILQPHYDDSRFWPRVPAAYPEPGKWRCDDPIYRFSRGGTLTQLDLPNCNAISGAVVNIDGFPTEHLTGSEIVFASRELTAFLNSVIVQGWSDVPTSGPSPVVRRSSSALAAVNGAQIVTEGAFFDLLLDRAEQVALENRGTPGEYYVSLAQLADLAAPDGEDVYVPAAVNDRAHMMASLAAGADVSTRLNVLGVPYGNVGAPWFPILANPETSAEAHISKIVERWAAVHELVKKLHLAADDVMEYERLEALAVAADELSLNLVSYSQSLEGAAKRDLIGKEAAKGQLLDVVDNIDTARADFENALRAVFELPECNVGGAPDCDFEAVESEMLAMAESVYEECASKNKADVFPDMIDKIAKLAPVAGTIVDGIDGVSGALHDASDGGGVIRSLGGNLSNASYAELASDFDDTTALVATAGNILVGVDKAKSSMEEIVGHLQRVENECKEPGEESAAIAMLVGVAQSRALLDTWALQAQTIFAVMSSIQSTLEYQLANMATNAKLSTDVTGVRSRIAALMDELETDMNSRAAFVVASCEAVLHSARVQQAELYGLSQLLQTSAGRTWVEPNLVVPAQDLRKVTGDLEARVDQEFPFFTNVWDASPFGSTVLPDGTVVEPFVEVAANRFSNLIHTNTCRNLRLVPGAVEPWPVSVSVVRKVLAGHELEEFKGGGTTEVTLNLRDLMRAEGVSGYTPTMLYDLFEDGYSVPMSAPVIAAIRYYTCSGGTADDPCCQESGACTYGAIQGTSAPMVVLQGGSLMPSAEGCEPAERATATLPVGDQLMRVSTCLVPVAAPNMKSGLESIEPSGNTEEFIWVGTDDMCEKASETLLLQGVRGLPLLGSWLLTHSTSSAQSLAAFGEGAAPSAEWMADNAGISGLELQFFIIAEPSASLGEPSPYTLEPLILD